MDKITRQIFMGNGDYTLMTIGYVYCELNRAVNILGDIQQPPDCHESPEACEEHLFHIEDAKIELKKIATEIYIALTGEKPNAKS